MNISRRLLVAFFTSIGSLSAAHAQENELCEAAIDQQFLYEVSAAPHWIFRTTDLLSSFRRYGNQEVALLRKLKSNLEDQGANLAMVVVPMRGAFVGEETAAFLEENNEYQNVITASEVYRSNVAKINASGIPTPDVLETHKNSQVPGDQFFYPRDHHWQPIAAELVARQLAELLERAGVQADTLKAHELVPSGGSFSFRPHIQQRIAELCGGQVETIEVPTFDAEPTEKADGDLSAALFGADTERSIAAVGTSTTGLRALNWPQHLSVALSSEAIPFAINGANHFSILPYLQTHWREADPWLVVWETSSSFPNEAVLRQAIGLTHEKCDKYFLQLKGETEINQEAWTELDFTISIQDLVVLSFPATGVSSFRARVSYEDDETREFSFSLPQRVADVYDTTSWPMFLSQTGLDGSEAEPRKVELRLSNGSPSTKVTYSACWTKFPA